jgi:hypothetical protein
MEAHDSLIKNSETLTSLFGYWPSFHDAEVISLTLNRDGPALLADIHVFEMTRQVSEKGTYVCRHHCVVTLRFSTVDQVQLEGFNQQNVLMGLRIEDVSARQLEKIKFEVYFDSSFGVDCSFACFGIEVLAVRPGVPEGSVYA